MLRLVLKNSLNHNCISSCKRWISITKCTVYNETQQTADKQQTSTKVRVEMPSKCIDEQDNKSVSIKVDKNTEKKDTNLKKATDKMNDNFD